MDDRVIESRHLHTEGSRLFSSLSPHLFKVIMSSTGAGAAALAAVIWLHGVGVHLEVLVVILWIFGLLVAVCLTAILQFLMGVLFSERSEPADRLVKIIKTVRGPITRHD